MAESVAIEAGVSCLKAIICPQIPRIFSSRDNSIEDKLERLETSIIPAIKSALDEAEKSMHKKPMVTRYKRKMRDAIDKGEDLADSFEYYQAFKGHMEKKNKIGMFLDYTKIIFLKGHLWWQCSQLSKYEQISVRAKAIQEQLSIQASTVEPNIIPTSLPPTVVLGRELDRETVVELLRKPVSGQTSALTEVPVVAIVGLPGCGKTTLAQYVYDSEKASNYFSVIMWVHMSITFDAHTVINKILDSAFATDCSNHHGCMCVFKVTVNSLISPEVYQNVLREKLRGKRFLLVLDNVPSVHLLNKEWIERWEQVFKILGVGAEGSRILMTAQTAKAAYVFGASGDRLHLLKDIEQDDYVELFMHYAMPRYNIIAQQQAEFKEVGRQIAEKLKKDLIAAKIIGTKLSMEPLTFWRSFSEGDWLDGTLGHLICSYKSLPRYLQDCLSFCSIFPKGFHVEETSIVSLWAAANYFNSSGLCQNPLDICKQYLQDLVHLFYLQTHAIAGHTYYLMNDKVHDLAEKVSQEYFFRGDSSENVPLTARHISVYASTIVKHRKVICRLDRLHTLLILDDLGDDDDIDNPLKQLFIKSKGLRIVQLPLQKLKKFIKLICKLKHLRCLILSGILPNSLPKPATTHYHLMELCSFNRFSKLENKLKLLTSGDFVNSSGSGNKSLTVQSENLVILFNGDDGSSNGGITIPCMSILDIEEPEYLHDQAVEANFAENIGVLELELNRDDPGLEMSSGTDLDDSFLLRFLEIVTSVFLLRIGSYCLRRVSAWLHQCISPGAVVCKILGVFYFLKFWWCSVWRKAHFHA